MRILLPPSEVKRSGGHGPPLSDLGGGPRGAHRIRVVRTVVSLGRRPAHAAEVLLLPPAARVDALAANHEVLRSPTMAALDRYDGVLYRALDVDRLTVRQRGIAAESVLIFSGLWGVSGGDEPVPLYRVPAAAVLPGIGAVGRSWRGPLERHLGPLLEGELTIDLRSTDYASMWPAGPGAIAVRVLTETAPGVRKAISHTGKEVKGRLTRELVTHRRPARTVDDIAAAVCRLGHRAEIRGLPNQRLGLDVVVDG